MAAQKHWAELEALRRASGGMLKPTDVVKFAKSPKTALHKFFEWDDSKAAKEHRLAQARSLITEYVITVEDVDFPVRALVSLPSDRAHGRGYRSIQDVMESAAMRAEYLNEALAALNRCKAKYGQLKELARVWSAIDKVGET